MNAAQHNYLCTSCREFVPDGDAVPSNEGKALGCVSGLFMGAASKNVWTAVGLAVAGAVLGHIIDKHVTPHCPVCGAVLKQLARASA